MARLLNQSRRIISETDTYACAKGCPVDSGVRKDWALVGAARSMQIQQQKAEHVRSVMLCGKRKNSGW
ncbi:hypothetical protein SP90_12080 [Halodesulfovibrio spirochaetisodalis]|uniref:Uncharacterized protein n=1 Tax=Halodesulfovibrio spirochaetisodalis TaxID=1560234 RepID=A0A1B7XAX8_9BACT|nr:hypothetical protein SP90_12080 [Halodesulfovibrio spirochaetisodalis]